MPLIKELESLKEFGCEDRCVLSMYLNTNPGDPELLNGGWKILLKKGLNSIEEYLTASEDNKELKAFRKLKKKVTAELENNTNNLKKSVVLFAAVEPELWSVHYVQVPAKTSFHWENKPVLEEMEYMYKAYPEAGVILPSFGEIRILDTAMGAVKDEMIYAFDPDHGHWSSQQEKSNIQDKQSKKTASPYMAPKPKTNLKGFFKGMNNVVEKLKKERGWKEIHISGETDAANAFAETLREKPASCIYKNLNNSKTNDIIHQVFEK